MSNRTLPPATVQSGFTGKWTPPPEYGTLISPEIDLTAADWQGIPPGMQGAPVPLQFVTNLGQQVGPLFIFFGTYVGPPGSKTGGPGCGYLSNPKTFLQSGSPAVFDTASMVPGPRGYSAIEGQPLVVLNPPGGSIVGSPQQIIANIQKELQELLALIP